MKHEDNQYFKQVCIKHKQATSYVKYGYIWARVLTLFG